MSKLSHEQYLNERVHKANDHAVKLGLLQDAFLDQIVKDVMDNDLTALDELFHKMLKIPGATSLLINYLPEVEQTEFVDLIGSEPEL